VSQSFCGVAMRTTAFVLFAVSAVAACAPFPELDALGNDTSPPPQLLPIDSLLQQAQAPMADPGPALAARAARLKARAAAIQAAPPAT
jgi:hypothetical protein